MKTKRQILKNLFHSDLVQRKHSGVQSEAGAPGEERLRQENRSESRSSWHAFPSGLLVRFDGSGSADLGVGSGI